MTKEELEQLEKDTALAIAEAERKIEEIIKVSHLKTQLELASNPAIQKARAEGKVIETLGVKFNALVEQGIKSSYYSVANNVTSSVIALCQMVMYAGRNREIAEEIVGVKYHIATDLVEAVPQMPYYNEKLDEIINEELMPLNIPQMATLLPQVFKALGQDPKHIDQNLYNESFIEELHINSLKRETRKMEIIRKAAKLELADELSTKSDH